MPDRCWYVVLREQEPTRFGVPSSLSSVPPPTFIVLLKKHGTLVTSGNGTFPAGQTSGPGTYFINQFPPNPKCSASVQTVPLQKPREVSVMRYGENVGVQFSPTQPPRYSL